jgi:hypothetical protein
MKVNELIKYLQEEDGRKEVYLRLKDGWSCEIMDGRLTRINNIDPETITLFGFDN